MAHGEHDVRHLVKRHQALDTGKCKLRRAKCRGHADGIAVLARHLHEATDGVTNEAQQVTQRDGTGVERLPGRAAEHLHQRGGRHGGRTSYLSLAAALGTGDAGARGEVEADGGCAVERVHDLLVVELKVIGERQHAAGHDTRGACRGSGDDHSHRGGALKHGHRAGHGIGLNVAHQARAQIVAAGGIDEFSLAADEAAERALWIGNGGCGLFAHDVEYAAHGGDGVGLAGQTRLTNGHDGADAEPHFLARIEQLLAVVEDFLGRDAGRERRGRTGELDKGRVIDIVELAQHGDDGVVGRAVGLKDGVGLAAHFGAVGAAEGDVYVGVGEQVGERGEHAGDVLVRHEERGIHA